MTAPREGRFIHADSDTIISIQPATTGWQSPCPVVARGSEWLAFKDLAERLTVALATERRLRESLAARLAACAECLGKAAERNGFTVEHVREVMERVVDRVE